MAQEENMVMDYASQKFDTDTSTETTATTDAISTEATTAGTEASTEAAIASTETTTTTAETTQASTEEQPTVDYAKILEEISGGTFKDVETFKSALPKIQEYDTLLSTKTELEEKLKVNPFANEYVAELDKMVRAGKSKDEIANFTRLSSMDLDSLPDLEVKVMAMVKSGYSEAIARSIVEDEYPIDLHEEGTTQRLILEEKLRVSSLQDRQALKDYKKDLTTVDTSAQDSLAQKQEQERLQKIADAEAHKNTVKQSVPKIAEALTGLGEVALNTPKEGEQEVKLKFDYTKEFKETLPKRIESFFLDGNMPMTEENIKFAEHFIKADYLAENYENLLKTAYSQGESNAWEKAVNKYENRSGLPTETVNVVNTNDVAKAQADFLQRVANGR